MNRDVNKVNTIECIERYITKIEQETKEIEDTIKRVNEVDCPIVLPLIGEFSAGKTTLINSLMDNKKLETATKPTTSTIYEVHFGCDSCHATVFNEDESIVEISDIENLKNEELLDAKVVTVFDTSTKVPSSTILVDTPGLSSSEPKHRQNLVEFLPKADAILLLVDINAQFTRSLIDFIKDMSLLKRPIYVVVTMCDTKSVSERENVRKLIKSNSEIEVEDIVFVSARTGELDELYKLFDGIQKDKTAILKKVYGEKLRKRINNIVSDIDEMLGATSSDKDLEELVRKNQVSLNQLKRNISDIICSISDDISECDTKMSRKFEDLVFNKLNSLVLGRSNNFDMEAISMINSISSLLMNEYKNNIRSLLREKVQKNIKSDISLSSLTDLDMSSVEISELSYNLDLNTMGHQYDKMIKTGLVAVALAGTAVVASKFISSAVANSENRLGAGMNESSSIAQIPEMSEGGSAVSQAGLNNVIGVVDSATDVGSMVMIKRAMSKMDTINRGNSIISTNTNNAGMLDSLIGLVTDRAIAKPQRVKAIRNYIDLSLLPEFNSRLNEVSTTLISEIQFKIENESQSLIEEKSSVLNGLKLELSENSDKIDSLKNELSLCKSNLIEIFNRI